MLYLRVSKNEISKPYSGETGEITMCGHDEMDMMKIEITKGEYGEIEKLFNEMNRKNDLDSFSFSIDPLTKHFSI